MVFTPVKVANKIKRLASVLLKLNKMNEYNKKAVGFLNKANARITITEAIPQTEPIWFNGKDCGIDYSVTLQRGFNRYTFHFWDSIANKEAGKKPNAYDVLACLNTFDDGNTFEDFCNSYGYEVDSRKALKTFKEVMKQTEALKKLFSPKQLDLLNDIN